MRSRATLAGVLLTCSFLWPVAAAPGIACASAGDRAALVVDTGDSVARLCVRLDAPSVSGLHLIELASRQHGLPYRFGEGGQAVCMLAGVGSTTDDCFAEYPEFWGFWRGNGSGGWAWSSTGAGSVQVGDGDIHGWSWGSGDGPDGHQAPPSTAYRTVCAPAAPSTPSSTDQGPGPGEREEAPQAPARTAAPETTVAASDTGPPGPDRAAGRGHEKKGPKPGRARGATETRVESADPLPSAMATTVDATSFESGETPSPPVAGFAALIAASALGGAGMWLVRRRRNRASDGQ